MTKFHLNFTFDACFYGHSLLKANLNQKQTLGVIALTTYGTALSFCVYRICTCLADNRFRITFGFPIPANALGTFVFTFNNPFWSLILECTVMNTHCLKKKIHLPMVVNIFVLILHHIILYCLIMSHHVTFHHVTSSCFALSYFALIALHCKTFLPLNVCAFWRNTKVRGSERGKFSHLWFTPMVTDKTYPLQHSFLTKIPCYGSSHQTTSRLPFLSSLILLKPIFLAQS